MPEISLHLLDLVQNSISAGAAHIRILLFSSAANDILRLTIEDDGKGMTKEFLQKVESPFTTTRTTRRVGMGIPLMKAGCEAAGGSFYITSEPGVGTKLIGSYSLSHIDRPPLGDFAGTVHELIVCNPTLDYYVELSGDSATIDLDTVQMREQIGDMPLNDPEISIWIKEYLTEAMAEAGIIR